MKRSAPPRPSKRTALAADATPAALMPSAPELPSTVSVGLGGADNGVGKGDAIGAGSQYDALDMRDVGQRGRGQVAMRREDDLIDGRACAAVDRVATRQRGDGNGEHVGARTANELIVAG